MPSLSDVLIQDGMLEQKVDTEDIYTNNNIMKDELYFDAIQKSKEIVLKLDSKNRNHLDKTSAIFWAIKSDPFTVQGLINNGDNKNSAVEQLTGMTALMYAIIMRNCSVVKTLLNMNVNIKLSNSYGVRAFDLAIAENLPEVVQALIDLGEKASCQISCSCQLEPPLLLAIKYNSAEVLEVLVKEGANIKMTHFGKVNVSPLHYAIFSGRFEMGKLLIEKGADVNGLCGCDNGFRPLHTLANPKLCIDHHDLHNHDRKLTNYDFKVCLEMAQFLVQKGADLNAVNALKESALFCAIRSMSLNLVQYLLQEKVDLTGRNFEDQTPLELAVLLSAQTFKKESDAKDDVEEIMLQLQNQYKIVVLLVRAGADVNSENKHGKCILEIATSNNMFNLTSYLVDKGADVNKKNALGRTYLHIAAEMGNKQLGEILIKNGANISAEDNIGLTPLEVGIVKQGFDSEFLKLFLNFGVDVKNKIKGVVSIYELASLRHDPELLKTFYQHGIAYDEPRMINTVVDGIYSSVIKNMMSMALKEDLKRNKQTNLLFSAQKNLFKGIRMNKINLVRRALEEGAEPKSCSVAFPYPLHFLAKNDYWKIMEELLKRGVQPNCLDNNKESPARIALRLGHYNSWLLLLQYGACYEEGVEELGWYKEVMRNPTLQRDHFVRLFSKLKSGGKLVSEPTDHFTTFLIICMSFEAVKKNNTIILEQFVMLLKVICTMDYSSNKILSVCHMVMNCVDKSGCTLLGTALKNGNSAIAEQLMQVRLSMRETM